MANPVLRFAAAGTEAANVASSTGIIYPDSVTTADYLIAHLMLSGPPTTVATPAGWTLIASNPGSDVQHYVWGKAGVGESGTLSVSYASQATTSLSRMYAYSNVSVNNPFTLGGLVNDTANTATQVTASLTTTIANSLDVVLAATRLANATPLSAGGMVDEGDYGGGNTSGHLTLFDAALTATGLQSSRTVTFFAATTNAKQTVRFSLNNTAQPPNAPTPTAPPASSTVDRAVTQRLGWTFSSPSPGDSQSAYDLQYRLGTGAFTVVSGTTANTFRDFPGATFPAGSIEWQVRTYGSVGLVGPYSASAFFTAADMPAGPTITAPVNNSTNGASTLPVTWSAPNQEAYQVRTVGDSAGSPDTATILTDTGIVVDSARRSLTVATPVNGRVEHVQVRVRFAALFSAYADARYTVAFSAPATPVLSILTSTAKASISVTVTNPTPTGSQPTVNSWDVYRRETLVGGAGIRIAAGLMGVYVDNAVASNLSYQYLIRAIGSTGTTADSAWQS